MSKSQYAGLKTNKKISSPIAWGTLVLVVVLAGGAIWFTAAGSPASSLLPAGAYAEHAKFYDITAKYPASTPLKGADNAGAVTLMQHFIKETVDQFKTDGDFGHLSAEDVKNQGLDQGLKAVLDINYETFTTPRTVSYVYAIYEGFPGAAHGDGFYRTFTFDKETGKSLALSDIFLPGTKYLDLLASVSRAKLPAVIGESAGTEQIDTEHIKSGTAPEAANFANFYLDGTTMTFRFSSYQVASYVAGPQTLPILRSELSRVLRQEYRQ